MTTTHLSPIGWLKLECSQTHLLSLHIVSEEEKRNIEETPPNEIASAWIAQIDEYFNGERTEFTLPIQQTGTPFQESVWNELRHIPYGNTISYKDLATRIGSPKAFRAVGNANGKNNLCIVVPCHRVVESDGGLGGYAYGVETKRRLIELEKKVFNIK